MWEIFARVPFSSLGLYSLPYSFPATHINNLLDIFICNIAVLVDHTTRYFRCDRATGFRQELELICKFDLQASGLFLIAVLEKLSQMDGYVLCRTMLR